MQQHPEIDFTKWSSLLNKKRFAFTDLSASTRSSLPRWVASGILEEGFSGSKFHPLTLIWLALVSDLEAFGVSTEKIKGCKEALFAPIRVPDGSSYPALAYYMIHTLVYRTPIFIVLTQDAELLLLEQRQYFQELQKGGITNHLCLSLHKEIADNLHSLYHPVAFGMLATLCKEELQILAIVRDGKYQSIRIAKKNGQVDLIEGVEHLSHTADIAEILQNGSYQNLEIKQHNGVVEG